MPSDNHSFSYEDGISNDIIYYDVLSSFAISNDEQDIHNDEPMKLDGDQNKAKGIARMHRRNRIALKQYAMCG